MNITCKLEDISRELKKALAFSSVKNSLSITSCALIEAKDDKVSIDTTNGNQYFHSEFNAEVVGEGSVAVPVEKMQLIMKNIRTDMVNISLNDDKLTITPYGDNSAKINVRIMSASKFPKKGMPETSYAKFSVEKERLSSMVESVVGLASTNTTRMFLTGVCMECKDGRMYIVATDTIRMGIASTVTEVELLQNIIIPTNFCEHVSELDGKFVDVVLTGGEMYISNGSMFINTSLLKGIYPNYMKVVPTGELKEFSLDKDEITSAINLISVLSDAKTKTIYIKAEDGGLTVFGSDDNYGDSMQKIGCDYSGEPFTICFQPQLLGQCLKSINTNRITVRFASYNTAWSFRPEGNEDLVYVVMPKQV